MVPELHDPAPLEHADAVGVPDGREPVGDGDRGAVARDVLQRPLNGRFGLVVHGAGRLVEDQHGRVLQDGPGDRDPLALASRELLAALAHDRLVSAGEPQDEVVRFGQARRLFDLVVGRVPTPVDDVLAHRPMEQEDVLAHESNRRAQVLEADILDGHAVEGDPAVAHVIEPEEQLHQRALSGPGRAYDSERLARRNRE